MRDYPYEPLEALKNARVEADLSQDELAEKAGVSADSISAWELGRTPVGPRSAWKLEQALGLAEGSLVSVAVGDEPSSDTARSRQAPPRQKPRKGSGKAKGAGKKARPASAKSRGQKPAQEASKKVEPARKTREAPKPVEVTGGGKAAKALSRRIQALEEKLLDIATELGDLALEVERYEKIEEAVRSAL